MKFQIEYTWDTTLSLPLTLNQMFGQLPVHEDKQEGEEIDERNSTKNNNKLNKIHGKEGTGTGGTGTGGTGTGIGTGTSTGIQGISKRWAPGCVKMRGKSCALLPAVGKQNATFSPYFTQPGANLLEIPYT